MSDSVRPHRRQPTRLPSPWDSPGKNTGVGCHFLLQCVKVKSESEVTQKVKSESEVAQSCPTSSNPMDCSLPAPPSMGFSRQECWNGLPLQAQSFSQVWLCEPVFSVHGIFPGKNTGMGCHFLLQRVFPTQGSNSCFLHLLRLLHCRLVLYPWGGVTRHWKFQHSIQGCFHWQPACFLRCFPGQFINITKVNFIALNTGSPKPFRSSAPETETITKYTYIVVQSLNRVQLFAVPQTVAC